MKDEIELQLDDYSSESPSISGCDLEIKTFEEVVLVSFYIMWKRME